MVPNLVEKITQPRAISASLCNSSKSHSSSLLNRVTKRVSQLGLTQDEVSEILSLLDAVGEGNSRSFSLIHEIQASFVEELSPYLRAASLLLENSISPLRTLSSSVHLG